MNCTFCGSEVVPGTGKMYVRRDGTVYHFCKAKCQRNMVGMGRVNRHVGWTKAYAEHKGDRMTANAAAGAGAAAKAESKAASRPAKKAAGSAAGEAKASKPAKTQTKAA